MHAHLTGVSGTPEERIVQLLKYAGRLGIERVNFFLTIPRNYDPTPQEFRRDNDDLLRALEAGGDRALGFVYLNPKYTEDSLRELDRCVRDGPMVGVKLWVALKCNDPRLDPIIQRATELNAVVFQHTWYKVGGKDADDLNARQKAEAGNLPGESTSEELAELARRHPKAKLIAGHIGGDWERGIRAIRAVKNVCAGIGGGDP
ncbi:MAG TPA: amidohydrolase, partial [Planctomycetaceae bacterium]|nr:amidohydrolase [Planctomycetaceae bacterium]